MGKLLKCITIVIFTWCLLGSLAWAELDQGKAYWVVGSFRNLDAAIREAARISAETGVETRYIRSTVAGVEYNRLLVAQSGDQDYMARLTLQLDNAGVREPWTMWVDDSQARSLPAAVEIPVTAAVQPMTSPGDTQATSSEDSQVTSPEQIEEGESVWLVVGSFTDYAAAQDMVEEILVAVGFIPELKDFVVGSQSVIRVMAGPYSSHQELEEARTQLQAAGYANSWSLQDDIPAAGAPTDDYAGTELDPMFTEYSRDPASPVILQQERTRMIRQSRDAIKQPENTIRPGFNLATLRKKGD